MVAGVRLHQCREFTACLPVKFSAVYDHTANGRTVTADEFCSGMNHDIRTVLDGTYQIRSCKGIVHYERNLMCMSDRCQLLDIHNIRVGISERFHMDGSGVFLNGILYLFVIKRIYEGCFDAVFRKRMSQQVIGASINILGSNDMLPCVCQILERICDGCCT